MAESVEVDFEGGTPCLTYSANRKARRDRIAGVPTSRHSATGISKRSENKEQKLFRGGEGDRNSTNGLIKFPRDTLDLKK